MLAESWLSNKMTDKSVASVITRQVTAPWEENASQLYSAACTVPESSARKGNVLLLGTGCSCKTFSHVIAFSIHSQSLKKNSHLNPFTTSTKYNNQSKFEKIHLDVLFYDYDLATDIFGEVHFQNGKAWRQVLVRHRAQPEAVLHENQV